MYSIRNIFKKYYIRDVNIREQNGSEVERNENTTNEKTEH